MLSYRKSITYAAPTVWGTLFIQSFKIDHLQYPYVKKKKKNGKNQVANYHAMKFSNNVAEILYRSVLGIRDIFVQIWTNGWIWIRIQLWIRLLSSVTVRM
jgi:hypothetical protein